MSKFTEGPWVPGCFVDKRSTCDCKYIFSDGYAGSIATISVSDGLLTSEGGNDCPPLDEAIANAHLIAASPEMYPALKLFLAGVDTGIIRVRQSDMPVFRQLLAQANAAISKAEGGLS